MGQSDSKRKKIASSTIEPDLFSDDPVTRLWKEWFESGKRICKKIDVPVKSDEPIYKDKVRFVCISDTHGKLEELLPHIPNGDILVHCGDFTNLGDRHELEEFNEKIGKLPHPHKIVIAGNHELGFDDSEDLSQRNIFMKDHGTHEGYKLLTNCTVIQDQMIEINGIKIYGTSWHPLENFAYYRPRGEPLLEKWNLIPDSIDVLLTHTPPLGHGDLVLRWIAQVHFRVGDVDLLNTIENRVKPKFHVFGHIHEDPGVTTNGVTTFINASICSHDLKVVNPPILFDVPLQPGFEKS
uniref:Calcineurin-like phosphoesterase domain-containing protein n=1 Tax=Acrobeloides nanus TaxID=290746 RepID=A0A914EGT4_9BILA